MAALINDRKKIKVALLSKLKDSTLTATDAEKLKLEIITANTAVGLNLPEAAGFKIPYFDPKGKKTSFYRIRYLEAPIKKGFAGQTVNNKPLRYIQLPNTNNRVYFAPGYGIDWEDVCKTPDVALVITEGELKAAAGCKLGIPVIGLGGVWNFRAVKKRVDLLPDLAGIKWKGRKVYIAYDSDAINNPLVMSAERVLAEKLIHLGADVHITRIPHAKKNVKVGLDDFIAANGKNRTLRLFSHHSYQFDLSAALHELNQEVIYIRDPGIVIEYESMLKMTPMAFTGHAYSNRFYIEYGTNKDGSLTEKKKAAARAWLEWEYRAELNGLTYAPGDHKVIPGKKQLNTWPGWGIEPKKGNVKPWKELLLHIFGNDKGAMRWFEQWCAYPVQHPGTKMFSAIVIWGLVEGSGKTMLGHTLMRLYGKNAIEIHDTQLRDDRNEWAEAKQFVLADDITGHSNRELANRLKTLITQKWVRLNPKYVPSYSVPDCINYFFTSNDVDAFFLTDKDRRYFIHEVNNGKPDPKWLKKYLDWRDSDDGIAALHSHLLGVNVSDFNPQAEAYKTDSKEQMVNLVRSELNDWVAQLGHYGDLYINGIKQTGDLWTSTELLRRYDPDGKSGVRSNGMARELSKCGYKQLKQIRTDIGPVRLFILRNHDKWTRASSEKVREHYAETCPEVKRVTNEANATKAKRKY